jgi:hypothetical protein
MGLRVARSRGQYEIRVNHEGEGHVVGGQRCVDRVSVPRALAGAGEREGDAYAGLFAAFVVPLAIFVQLLHRDGRLELLCGERGAKSIP